MKKSYISGIAMMLIFVWLCAHNDMRTFWRFEGGIEFWKIGNNLDQNCHPSTAFPHPQFFENVPLLALKDRHLDPAEAFVFLVIFFCKKYVSTYRFWPKFFLKLYHILNTTVVTKMCLCGNVKLDKRRSSWLCFVNIFSKSPRFVFFLKEKNITSCCAFLSFLCQNWELDVGLFYLRVQHEVLISIDLKLTIVAFWWKKKKINFFLFFVKSISNYVQFWACAIWRAKRRREIWQITRYLFSSLKLKLKAHYWKMSLTVSPVQYVLRFHC